ncbi:MAG: cupin domain-containing protein [Bryobacteraceae bacterium]
MSKSIVIATPATFELGPQTQPITPSWVLAGAPVSRTKSVARSYDWTENIVVWDCTAGRFEWHYCQDETAVVISGEAFILNKEGEERRLGPGDVVFFPAGTSCTWRVPERIRKIAVVRETMWRPIGFGLKVWKKLLRMTGLAGKAPL